jgi:hypothetical protein
MWETFKSYWLWGCELLQNRVGQGLLLRVIESLSSATTELAP